MTKLINLIKNQFVASWRYCECGAKFNGTGNKCYGCKHPEHDEDM